MLNFQPDQRGQASASTLQNPRHSAGREAEAMWATPLWRSLHRPVSRSVILPFVFAHTPRLAAREISVVRDNSIAVSPLTCGLVRRKARRLARRAVFADMEVADLEQELMVRLLAALDRFNSNEGRLDAYVTGVLSRLVAFLIRQRSAKKRYPVGQRSLDATVEASLNDFPHDESAEELINLNIDLAEVLELLAPDQRDLAERLRTQSLAEIARDMKVPRSSLQRRVERIRRRFEDRGLAIYL
jgi:RNA polymerase sigma factor (sigma-70 family)